MIVNVYLLDVPQGNLNDPWLGDPTTIAVTVGDDRWFPERVHPRPPLRRQPPRRPVVVAQSLYGDLISRYGSAEGRRIYFEMEQQHLGPFAPGRKYDATRRRPQDGLAPPRDERAPVLEIPKATPARRN